VIIEILNIIGIPLSLVVVILIATLGILLRHGFKQIGLSPYALPQQITQTWDEVFSKPAPVSVVAFNTGKIEINRYPDNLQNAEDRYKPTDIPAFWVHHEQFGDILIDTGLDRSFSDNPPFGNYPLLVKVFLKLIRSDKISQEKGQDMNSFIESHNIRPQKVFFTYLHGDHTAGVPALPNSIEYVIHPKEMNFLARATLLESHFKNLQQLKTLDFTKAQEMPPFNQCLDLLEDGSLWAVATPGHTRGHMSYVVNAKGGPVLITGDAAFYYWSFENGIGSKIDVDKQGSQKSREQLLAFSKQYPQMKVFLGHEMPEDN
jgi:N-acyl homoserine lactone hydrolase